MWQNRAAVGTVLADFFVERMLRLHIFEIVGEAGAASGLYAHPDQLRLGATGELFEPRNGQFCLRTQKNDYVCIGMR